MNKATDPTDGAATAVKHPLDPITASEITSLKAVLAEAGHAGDTIRYSYVMLREPDRAVLEGFTPGDPVPREIGVLVTDVAGNTAREMVVDIPAAKIVHDRALNPATDGWGPVLDEDYEAAEVIAKADPRFVEALKKRGIDNLDHVFCAPLSAGVFGDRTRSAAA